jgi:hypothetical protein
VCLVYLFVCFVFCVCVVLCCYSCVVSLHTLYTSHPIFHTMQIQTKGLWVVLGFILLYTLHNDFSTFCKEIEAHCCPSPHCSCNFTLSLEISHETFRRRLATTQTQTPTQPTPNTKRVFFMERTDGSKRSHAGKVSPKNGIKESNNSINQPNHLNHFNHPNHLNPLNHQKSSTHYNVVFQHGPGGQFSLRKNKEVEEGNPNGMSNLFYKWKPNKGNEIDVTKSKISLHSVSQPQFHPLPLLKIHTLTLKTLK